MKDAINRRVALKSAALAAAFAVVGGCAESQQEISQRDRIDFDNSYFYDANGRFKPEAGKDAYIAMMEYHGYPVLADVREKLRVSDYGKGQFAKLGLGANMFVNNEKDQYMLMGLFLLLEHRKIKIPGERLLSVFGKNSLFCFIAQWCVIHAVFLVLVKTHASLYVRWAGLIVTVAIVYLLAVVQAGFLARRRAAAKLKAKSPAD